MKWIKRGGLLVAALVVLAGLAAGGVWGFTSQRFGRSVGVQPERIEVSLDSATLERGRHVAFSIAKCADCHGDDFGGKVVVDDPMMGYLGGPNLTTGKGGVGGQLTDEDLVRAIRYGVAPDGRPLLFMPSDEFAFLSDADLAAVIAYVKTRPPVDRDIGRNRVRLLPRVLYTLGDLPMLVSSDRTVERTGSRTAPAEGPTAAYGEYLARAGGCFGCHGEHLQGGKIPGSPPDWPPALNLTPTGDLGSWTVDDFRMVLRTGVRPDGRQLSTVMPWPYTSGLTDDEIAALWKYLQSVPPAPAGT